MISFRVKISNIWRQWSVMWFLIGRQVFHVWKQFFLIIFSQSGAKKASIWPMKSNRFEDCFMLHLFVLLESLESVCKSNIPEDHSLADFWGQRRALKLQLKHKFSGFYIFSILTSPRQQRQINAYTFNLVGFISTTDGQSKM